MNLKILIVIFLVLLGLNLSLAYYLFKSDTLISVSNQDTHYTLSYKKDTSFENILKKWGYLLVNNRKTNIKTSSPSVKKIIIETVTTPPTPNTFNLYTDSSKKSTALSAGYQKSSTTGIILIYINPTSLASLNNMVLNKSVLNAVLITLYPKNAKNVPAQNDLTAISNRYYTGALKNPFHITVKSK